MKRLKLLALAAIALAACMDGGRFSGPNFAISDATHGAGGNPFFHWLPPIVKSAAPTGQFNPFLAPVVEICDLDGTTCGDVVATFTQTTGPGGETIRLSGDQYHLNWHTNEFDLAADTFRITVRGDGQVLGYADVVVGNTGRDLRNVNTNEYLALVDGRTLPIKFRIEVGATCAALSGECTEAIVSPSGGVVTVTDGSGRPLAFADFPDGWTDAPALVRIERIPDAAFGPREGPLGTDFPQYPLFFDYFTTAPEPFNLLVRIGVCNIDFENSFHPPDRATTALAMGGTSAEFRVLAFAPTADILSRCSGVTGGGGEGGGDIGFGGIGGWRGVVARAGSIAAKVFAPRPLHATSALVLDGGMGGETDAFTPAGTVDTATAPVGNTIFRATFTDDSPDEPPGAPDIGSWELIAPIDGTILVRAAVGDLTDQPVEVDNRGQLAGTPGLHGLAAGTPPTTGVYVARWRSVISAASEGFWSTTISVLSGGLPTHTIAIVAYLPQGQLNYGNSLSTDDQVATWTLNESQLFELTVDLDAKTTSLRVDGVLVVENEPFFDTQAASIGRIRIGGGGTAANTLGWDDVEITRLTTDVEP